MKLSAVAFMVRDYDEAIAWFVDVLGFACLEDTDLGGGKRWVRVATPDAETALLLARAATPEQAGAIGKAAGGRVAYFLEVDDFDVAHDRLSSRGVAFHEKPRHEGYGRVAVFADLYGNRWDLIGASPQK